MLNRKSKITNHRLQVGFTLIELLVVIAIISLLVSILLPSLNKAKDLAKRVVCASNVHGMSLVYNFYANEYNNYMPVGYIANRKQYNYLIYASSEWNYVTFGYLYLANMMEEPKLFICPTYPELLDHPNNPWPPDPDSGLLTRAGYGCRPEVNWVSESEPPDPFPNMDDLAGKAILSDKTSTPGSVDQGHVEGVNVGYGDGSSLWVDRDLFDEDLEVLGEDGGSYSSSKNPFVDNIWEAFDDQR